MKVLFATGEAWPFIKTGGLGDVAYSLPKALKDKGVDARVILPKYKQIPDKYKSQMKNLGAKKIWVSHYDAYVGIEKYVLDGVIYYFVDNMDYFSRDKIYGEIDDCERFTFFSKSIVETFDLTGFTPDIIHCNDWHTALVPIYVIERKLSVKTIFTIHNLRYQGFFPNVELEETLEISREKYYKEDGLKFYDVISFLKGGVVYSDYVTTVSKTYAQEIKTPEYGEGIDGLFRKFDYKLTGIVNGVDDSVYKNSNVNKADLKKKLQEKLGLTVDKDVPIVAVIARLDRQKGIDLIIQAFDRMMAMGIQFILLGSGDEYYSNFFRWKESQYRGQVCSYIGFNQELSIDIYAGADIFLMPSLFEPCGLSQMIAMEYGTIPLVRETGGLKDTVTPYNEYTGQGNGFSFIDATPEVMLKILAYALKIYHNKKEWQVIVKHALERDSSWNRPAQEYIDVYKKVLK